MDDATSTHFIPWSDCNCDTAWSRDPVALECECWRLKLIHVPCAQNIDQRSHLCAGSQTIFIYSFVWFSFGLPCPVADSYISRTADTTLSLRNESYKFHLSSFDCRTFTTILMKMTTINNSNHSVPADDRWLRQMKNRHENIALGSIHLWLWLLDDRLSELNWIDRKSRKFSSVVSDSDFCVYYFSSGSHIRLNFRLNAVTLWRWCVPCICDARRSMVTIIANMYSMI